jgi:hypothetical protein
MHERDAFNRMSDDEKSAFARLVGIIATINSIIEYKSGLPRNIYNMVRIAKDHVIPISVGGAAVHTISNMQILNSTDNSQKSAMLGETRMSFAENREYFVENVINRFNLHRIGNELLAEFDKLENILW